jgi:hypothetical protein
LRWGRGNHEGKKWCEGVEIQKYCGGYQKQATFVDPQRIRRRSLNKIKDKRKRKEIKGEEKLRTCADTKR